MDREALVKARCKQSEREEEKIKKAAMHIQFIWEQLMLLKWWIKKA